MKGEQRVGGQDGWSDMHAERRWGREGLRRLTVESEESPPRDPQIQLSGPSIWLLLTPPSPTLQPPRGSLQSCPSPTPRAALSQARREAVQAGNPLSLQTLSLVIYSFATASPHWVIEIINMRGLISQSN